MQISAKRLKTLYSNSLYSKTLIVGASSLQQIHCRTKIEIHKNAVNLTIKLAIGVKFGKVNVLLIH